MSDNQIRNWVLIGLMVATLATVAERLRPATVAVAEPR